MHASRKHGVISVFAVSILFHSASSAPQYFEDRDYNPVYERSEDNGATPKDDAAQDKPLPDYYNYQGNEFLSDSWFPVNTLPTQDSFWPPEVADSLTPPVYAESQFNSVISEPENEPLSRDGDLASQLQRGRSDIDPEEDEEEFGGYFYPKPKIPFDLPEFKPVGAETDQQTEAKVITTSEKPEETTEKATTTTTTTTTVSTMDSTTASDDNA